MKLKLKLKLKLILTRGRSSRREDEMRLLSVGFWVVLVGLPSINVASTWSLTYWPDQSPKGLVRCQAKDSWLVRSLPSFIVPP